MSRAGAVPDGDARAAERIEREAWRDLFAAAAPADAEACGLACVERGGALVHTAARVDVLALNRVVGLGVGADATPEGLDAALGAVREAGVPRWFVTRSPLAGPAALDGLLRARGLAPYNRWVRLVRDGAPPAPAASALTVRPAGPGDAAVFGALLAEAFGWPAEVGAWMGRVVGRPRWHAYLLFDGEAPVGTGTWYRARDGAWLSFGATLPAARGRGGQAAMLARRVADAARAGCALLTVETGVPSPERDVPSYRNCVRAGFRPAHERENWIGTRGPAAP